MSKIKQAIINSIETKLKLVRDSDTIEKINLAGQLLISALERGDKILIAGNGGSAADAQHFAAELAGKFIHKNRRGLAAISLTTNSSVITAIANDFGYEYVFSRQIDALGAKGDVFFGISTSGNSKNLILANQMAKQKELGIVGLLGNSGGQIISNCDLSIVVPSTSTQAIQESHVMIIHILCRIIDDYFA